MANYEYQIGYAQKQHAKGLAELAKVGFPGYPFDYVYHPRSLVKALANEHRIVALLKPDLQKIIGTAVLGLSQGEFMAEIKRVIVDPSKRRNGLAENMTKRLVQDAKEKGVRPYTDTRADQIGMQIASLRAGLVPYSIETGKHVVYSHLDVTGKHDGGAARESMIHMSILTPPEDLLHFNVNVWDQHIKEKLIENMHKSLKPASKTPEVVKRCLINASAVKRRLLRHVEEHHTEVEVKPSKGDVTEVKYGNVSMVIINPDASGFMNVDKTATSDEVKYMLDFAQRIGLQIVTTYQNVDDLNIIQTLSDAKMEPGMIRPWQTGENEVKWQVGMRKTMNDYEQCLHHINIEEGIERQINGFISRLENSVLKR